jgi:Rps23 Pro-64 3,4-dihydroxylase Tpa1-like proline 4-hydroxylase
MTGKQVLDAFSETLMQDERILSPRERELLTSLLQNSRTISGNSETQSAVAAAIARSVGETVAQRAFTLLGSSIVEQILARSGIAAGTESTAAGAVSLSSPQPPGSKPLPAKSPQPPGSPQPPAQVPQPPGMPHEPHKSPHPGSPMPPAKSPQPPGSSPQPPGGSQVRHPLDMPVLQGAHERQVELGSVGVLEPPAAVQAQCVILDEFLAPQELEELIDFTLQRETEFQNSEVISPSGEPGVTDYDHRRSRVLMDLGKHQEIILERIRGVLPGVMERLGMEEFRVEHVETQITASNDGDFFGVHSDDAHERIASRHLTFVYFFHRDPSPFEGGELRLHDSIGNGGQQIKAGGYQKLVPRQNQIVFFPCSVLHEITPVNCHSKAFADSRFTLNGWLHK